MFVLIAGLLVSSLIILCFEEYIEDQELEASRQLRQGGKLSYPVTGDVKACFNTLMINAVIYFI
jgi:hypothetical protein